MASLVPVKVVQKNNLSAGLVVSSIEPAHSQLTVTMPSLAIEELAYVGLEIDMSQIKESCTVMCPVTYCNSDGRQIAEKGFVNTDKIAVSITLERRKTVDIYTDIRVNGALPEDCELEPSFTQIEIYGNSEAVNAIDRLSTEPLVFDRVPQVGEEFFVKIILPEGVHLNDGTSDKVKITMKNKNE
jgi:YbbR domain-containing protein